MEKYAYITKEKRESLGQILTVRELCDMWWNSVRIRWNNEDTPTALIYKDCYDNSYSIDDLEHNPLGENVLDLKVQVDDHYEEDADGYPIIFVDEIKEEKAFYITYEEQGNTVAVVKIVGAEDEDEAYSRAAEALSRKYDAFCDTTKPEGLEFGQLLDEDGYALDPDTEN